MSLLNSVLGSLGSGHRTQLPKGPERASTSTPPSNSATSSTRSSVIPPATKPKVQNAPSQANQAVSLKRKPDGSVAQRNGSDKSLRPNPSADRPRSTGASLPSSSVKQSATPGAQTTSSAPTKPPAKGSYMDLLNQANALQAEKAAKAQQVGMIKHVPSSKDRMTKSERRRKEEELRAQAKAKGGRVTNNGAIKKPGQPPNGKSRAKEPLSYKGTARPPPGANGVKDKPVAERSREEPSYKGTAGLKKPPPSKKYSRAAREDRYLDTDDDEESEGSFIVDDDPDDGRHHRPHNGPRYRYAEDDEDDSDMEAGYSDVEDEEVEAERFAKREDAKEKALEERLRKEKEAKRKAFERGR